jgi:hypothetical protein
MLVGVEVLPIIVVELLVQGEQPDQVVVVLLVYGTLLDKKMELLTLEVVVAVTRDTITQQTVQIILVGMVAQEL